MSSRFLTIARTPVNWRYGAIASGVALTQGLGYLWYSPLALGSVWAKDYQSATYAASSEEVQKNALIGVVSDTGFAILLHYLSDRYFRPVTVQDAFFFAALIGLVQTLPQVPHVLWGKRKVNGFLIDHAFNVLGIFIKLLCIQNIAY